MNIVNIELGTVPEAIEIYHNGQLITTESLGQYQLELTTQTSNVLSVVNVGSSLIHVKSIAMFDMGHDKLVYLGLCHDSNSSYQSQDIRPGVQWQLEYSYPVFSWLHKTLNYGWLIQPD
jgi:hypothetical protein